MNRKIRILSTILATALIAACAGVPPVNTESQGASSVRATPGMRAPSGSNSGGNSTVLLDASERMAFEANGPFPVDLRDIPARVYDPNNQLDRIGNAGRIESPIPDELVELLREEARLLPPSVGLRQAKELGVDPLGPGQLGPVTGVTFDSLDYGDCCGGGGNVPPDSELAVGPDHIIAVVNVAFAIYDKGGNLLSGPTTFSSFFGGTLGCSNTGVFDPNVLYDEEYDRFILGIDGDGTDYCVAATTGSSPLGTWNRYGFSTVDSGSEFFDYPHAGVGLDAIYMGANIFVGGYSGSRVWAMDKLDLYSGAPLSVVRRSTGGESTPQPMNLHGFDQGSWPLAGPHYVITDHNFSGNTYGVWSWDDPFGADTWTNEGSVNLTAFTGVSAGMPLYVPQLGGNDLQGNDYRVQDAEYRNGDIWIANTIACNPGTGTVNCVRWAQIDPVGPTIVDAGVQASNDEYRTFADVAANHCDDMAMGYTRSSSSTYPSVYVSGRESTDPAGSLQAEVQVKAGEKTYTPFDSAPYRWGDYSGMTIDPDGLTFWYLGEYSKNMGGTNWGNFIGSFTFPDCTVAPLPAPGQVGNPSPSDGATGVDIDANLGWSPGSEATSYRVYLDGNFLGSTASTTFDPGTLAENTSFNWRVDSVNTTATTTGDTWSFETGAAPEPPEFHLAVIDVVSVPAKGNRNRGQATVTVTDENDNPVSGVALSGTFGGDWSGTRGDTTDANGQVVVQTPPVRNGSNWTFCVDTASKSGWVADQSINSFLWCNAPVTTGAIAGVVTDSSTSNPIAGASVSADTGQSDTTDGFGNYSLNNVPTGSRSVTASANGYVGNSASTFVTDGATSTVVFDLDPVPVGTGALQVRSITVSAVNQGRGNKSGLAVIVVEDDGGSVVSGATVTGDFSGTFNETVSSGPTNASGSTSVETSGTAKGGVSVTYCVTEITHPTLTDFSGNVCASQ